MWIRIGTHMFHNWQNVLLYAMYGFVYILPVVDCTDSRIERKLTNFVRLEIVIY